MNRGLASLYVITGIIACWFLSPALSLLLGAALGILFSQPFGASLNRWIKILLQASVVGLGFGMNLHEVLKAGLSGFSFSALSISLTLLAGYILGRMLAMNPKISYLLSTGTAICGGSAIAAVAPVIQASSAEITVSMGTVFLLNAAALFIFPEVAHYLNLTDAQFGLWSAIAIHDTSSVVGAASRFSDASLAIAVPVKLARALWILPLTMCTPWIFRQKNKAARKAALPWFILFFLIASLIRTQMPEFSGIHENLFLLSKKGLSLTLFLIGCGISKKTLHDVGIKPALHGTILWLLVSCITLLTIFWGNL